MAESNRDEIAKLESMYAANPEGRVFTHLAEAYRKAGDLARAREVLEDGLQRHSDSASGHVVLGRVMQDLAQPEEAAAAFARVLELDPENRVALRALGELARAAGDTEQAMAHFGQLLALDPSDESVELLMAQLRSGDASNPAPAAAEQPPAGGMPSAESASPAAETRSAQDLAPVPEASSAAAAEMSAAAADALPAAGLAAAEAEAAQAASSGETVFADAAPAEEAVAALDLSAFTGGAPDQAPSDAEGDEPFADLHLPSADAGWMSADDDADTAAWPGTGEEGAALLRLEGLESLHGEEDDDGEVSPLPLLEDTQPEEAGTPVDTEQPAAGEAEGADIADWESVRQAEVPTETLAELYRAQGHLNRASDVYRALLRDHPGDEELERKLLDVEVSILSGSLAEPAAFAEAEAASAEEPEPRAPLAELESASPADITGSADVVATAHTAAPTEAEPWAMSGGPADVQESAAAVPEPWAEGALAQAEPVGPAAESPSLEPVALAEAAWTNAGELPADEPTPYAWDGGAAEEEVGPPIAAYLRGLVAWRRGSAVEAAYPPASGGYDQPLAEGVPAAYQEKAGYADLPGFDAPAPVVPDGEHGPGDHAAAAGYDAALGAAQPDTAPPPDWLDAPADVAPADAAPAADEPWAAPAEPTVAEEPAQEPWTPEEASADIPSGDMDWLNDADAGAEQISASPADGAAAEGETPEGPAADDDLEMFRAWLQSLKK